MNTVWLWCIHEAANIACGDQRAQRQYEVRDHVVEVEEQDAFALCDTIQTHTRFGRFQIPEAVYRAATEAEVNEHAARHPEVAKRRKAALRAQHKERSAAIAAQLAALQAEQAHTEALLGGVDEDEDETPTKKPAPRRKATAVA